MKNRLFLNETEYNRFFKTVEMMDKKYIQQKNGELQLVKFFKWCFDNGFLDNLTDENIDQFYIYKSLPLLKNNGICVGMDMGEWLKYGGIKIGIDPTNCFDKTRTCSIIANLPMSKREEDRFYRLLNRLTDKKDKQSIEWRREASADWYGSYASFNCN